MTGCIIHVLGSDKKQNKQKKIREPEQFLNRNPETNNDEATFGTLLLSAFRRSLGTQFVGPVGPSDEGPQGLHG